MTMNTSPFPRLSDVSSRYIAWFSSVLVVTGLVAMFFVEIETKQDVPGEVVSDGEIKVTGMAGTVVEVFGHQDGSVQAGEPLFRLQRDFSLASNGEQRQRFDEASRDEKLASVDARYDAMVKERETVLAGYRNTRRSLDAELAMVARQVASRRSLVDLAQETLNRLSANRKYVYGDQVDAARSNLQQQRVALQESMMQQEQLRQRARQVDSDIAVEPVQLDAIAANRRRDRDAVISSYEQGRSDVTVASPVDGTLVFSRVYTGMTLRPDDVAVVVSTDVEPRLRVVLRIPSRRRGFIEPGQVVRLKFDAFPYARFGSYEARIQGVSPTTVVEAETEEPVQSMPKSTVEPSDDGGQFVAWVALPTRDFRTRGQSFRILPGMRATAAVVIERRTVAEWVLQPVFEAVRS